MSMTERIEALLKKTEGISDYKINTVNTESYELFFVHKNLETVRSTDTTDIKVTVFALHDGKLGDYRPTDEELEAAFARFPKI